MIRFFIWLVGCILAGLLVSSIYHANTYMTVIICLVGAFVGSIFGGLGVLEGKTFTEKPAGQ